MPSLRGADHPSSSDYAVCAAAHAGWLGAGAGSGSDAVVANAEARAQQGADVWRALEALLRVTGSELQDVVLSDDHDPETYYTVVRLSVID